MSGDETPTWEAAADGPADVLLVTYEKFPRLTPDDQILQRALVARGLRARAARWDDPAVDWAGAGMAVLRSTWDYFLRPEEFSRWLDRVASRTRLINPLPLVRWNFHKGYLLDLAARGVATVPTRLVRATAAPVSLSVLAEESGWHELVVKPAISGGAHLALRCGPSAVGTAGVTGQAHLEHILASGDALLQPYVPAVETAGERSLVIIDGMVTHGFRKAPFSAGLFGGESKEEAYRPTAAEEAFARRVLELLPMAPQTPLYARVDLVPGDRGPLLMELELIEPALQFRFAPAAAERLAAALLALSD